jgi:hypothetical protein
LCKLQIPWADVRSKLKRVAESFSDRNWNIDFDLELIHARSKRGEDSIDGTVSGSPAVLALLYSAWFWVPVSTSIFAYGLIVLFATIVAAKHEEISPDPNRVPPFPNE